MLSNSKISIWRKRTPGGNLSGDQLVDQAGGPWPVLLEIYETTVDYGGQQVQSSHRMRGQHLPGLSAGDRLVISGVEYVVLKAQAPLGNVPLAHWLVYLGLFSE